MIAFDYAARTDLGLGAKSRNEDSGYASPDLLLLCDGMGGHAAGDVASSTVVGELVSRLDGEAEGVEDAADQLEGAIEEANGLLAQEMAGNSDVDGMGTTCIALLRVGNKLVQANIGDSRAFLLRGGRLTQITKDHSFVQTLLDEGRITPDEAQHHPQRSLVTRVLTGRPEDKPDLSVREAKPGDRLLLCSDGLSDYVAQDTIEEILALDAAPGTVADKLIQIALRASARDNVTVVVADIVDESATTPTVPQVVGAAANRRTTEPAPKGNTPAEKAAALTRTAAVAPAAGEDIPPVLAEEEPGRRRPLRGIILGLLTLGLLALAAWGAYAWSQTQYFLAEKDGRVTIYRGLSENLGPLRLSSVAQVTDLPLDVLPEYQQERVRTKSLDAGSREDIDRTVSNLRQSVTDDGHPAEPAQTTTSPTTDAAAAASESASRDARRRAQEEEEARRRQARQSASVVVPTVTVPAVSTRPVV